MRTDARHGAGRAQAIANCAGRCCGADQAAIQAIQCASGVRVISTRSEGAQGVLIVGRSASPLEGSRRLFTLALAMRRRSEDDAAGNPAWWNFLNSPRAVNCIRDLRAHSN